MENRCFHVRSHVFSILIYSVPMAFQRLLYILSLTNSAIEFKCPISHLQMLLLNAVVTGPSLENQHHLLSLSEQPCFLPWSMGTGRSCSRDAGPASQPVPLSPSPPLSSPSLLPPPSPSSSPPPSLPLLLPSPPPPHISSTVKTTRCLMLGSDT